MGSDTVVQSVAAAEQTNRKGIYRATFNDVPAATYLLIGLNPSNQPLAIWWVKLLLSASTFQAYELPEDVFGGSGGGGGDAQQATLLEVQTTAEGIAATLAAAAEIAVRSAVDAAGDVELVLGDDYRIRSGSEITLAIPDVGGVLLAELQAVGAVVSWSAGHGRAGGLITGTPNVAGAVNALGITTLPVEVTATQLSAGDPRHVYEWQLKVGTVQGAETDIRTIADGALRLKYDRS